MYLLLLMGVESVERLDTSGEDGLPLLTDSKSWTYMYTFCQNCFWYNVSVRISVCQLLILPVVTTSSRCQSQGPPSAVQFYDQSVSPCAIDQKIGDDISAMDEPGRD